jgi:hypothetical protein
VDLTAAKGSRMAISIDLLRVFALLFGKVDGQDELIDRLSHSRALSGGQVHVDVSDAPPVALGASVPALGTPQATPTIASTLHS